MAASSSEEIQKLLIFERLLPSLYDLSLPDVTKRVIPQLDGSELVPKPIAIGRDTIGQPLKQNNITTANQETSSTKGTRTKIL